MATTSYQTQLSAWQSALSSGNPGRISATARALAEAKSKVDIDFRFTVTDFLWQPVGEIGTDLISGSGTDPRNNCPTARVQVKGNSDLIDHFMGCRETMVGVIVETADLRYPFYLKTHRYKYEDGALTGNLELKGIWDVLNYMVIWPDWYLPIEAQLFSYAVYFWALQTCLESMVAECAMRLQLGMWEFVNNALSLNPDINAWFGSVLQGIKRDGLSINTFLSMLKTPIYVKRTNPFTDTSPFTAKTVRMQSCGEVIRDLTRAYGVEASMDLWLPGDPQPDKWAHLTHPTYVFSTKDRSQISGPTHTIFDSVLRTGVDLGGSLGGIFDGLIHQIPGFSDQFYSPALGQDYEAPVAVLVVPKSGEKSVIVSADIADHTPEGWQHIIGGRSPKWLNDLMNAYFSWVLDALSILIGFTGIPSDLLAGFLNNSFLAFQLVELYNRRNTVGPYHPAIERFYATASAPFNLETEFAFINAFFDSRGYTAAQVVFRNGEQYAIGRDIFRGGLMSLVYHTNKSTYMLTDYIENVMWRITETEREVLVQLGDGKKDEAPLAKIQRFITESFSIINTLTLSPQSS